MDFEDGVDYGLFVRGDLVVEAIGPVDVGVIAVDIVDRFKVVESIFYRPLSAQVWSILSDDDTVNFIVRQTEDSDTVIHPSVVRKNIHIIFDVVSNLYAVSWQIIVLDRVNAQQKSDTPLQFSDAVLLQIYQHTRLLLQVDIVFRADDWLSGRQPFLVMVSQDNLKQSWGSCRYSLKDRMGVFVGQCCSLGLVI